MDDCFNVLTVDGDKREVERFRKGVKGRLQWGRRLRKVPFCLESLLPPPTPGVPIETVPSTPTRERLATTLLAVVSALQAYPVPADAEGEGTQEPVEILSPDLAYGAVCIAYWGTQCDVSAEYNAWERLSMQRLRFHFDSAWSPPDRWVVRVSRLFPSLAFELRWEVPDADTGLLRVRNGEILEDIERKSWPREEYEGFEGDPFEIAWYGYVHDDRSYPEWKPEQ